MDEPKLTKQVIETDVDAAKSDMNEVLSSAFGNEEIEKPINVDDVVVSEEPSTSADVVLSKDATDIKQSTVQHTVESTDEDAGHTEDVSMDELAVDSVEQVTFGSPNNQSETVQPEIDNEDNVDYTEHSINISQLNVELTNHDDSNDAFNALKESETDALQEPKEELEQKDEDQKDEQNTAVDAQENIESSRAVNIDAVQVNESIEVDSTDVPEESLSKTVGEAVNESHDAGTTPDLECNDSLGLGLESPETHHKPDNEDTEEVAEGKIKYCSDQVCINSSS